MNVSSPAERFCQVSGTVKKTARKVGLKPVRKVSNLFGFNGCLLCFSFHKKPESLHLTRKNEWFIQWFCSSREKKKSFLLLLILSRASSKNLTVKIPNNKTQLTITKANFRCNDMDDTYVYECAPKSLSLVLNSSECSDAKVKCNG